MKPQSPHHDRLDQAVRQRLARLGNQPVDTTQLEAKLSAVLRESSPPISASRPRRWLSPTIALAAMLVIAASVFMIITATGPTAQAAVVELRQLHNDILAGRVHLTPVQTIDQANDWIAAQRRGGPQLPGHLNDLQVQSCCLADVQGRMVAVALLEDQGATVTLVVARAENFGHRMGKVYRIGDREYFAHTLDGVNMVMTNRDDHWLCVMGDVNDQRLLDVASRITF